MRNFIFICQRRRELILNLSRFSRFAKHYHLVVVLLYFLLLSGRANAQFTTPTVDAALDAVNYPTNYSTGSSTWHMTWDDTYLYVFLQNANETEPVSLFLDVDPIVPVNGGSNSNGTLVGLNYNGYTTPPNLPFRADIFIYCHNGYREIRRRDGANGWTSLGGGSDGLAGGGTSDYTGNANGQYASNNNGNGAGGDDRREFRISWTRLLGTINSGNRPASFNWMGYVSYTNGMYAQVPLENYNGGAVSSNSNGITRYFTVSATSNGSSISPFGRNSYTHPLTATNNSFGGISVWDFTMNSSGQQISRLNSGGNWTIGGNLIVNSGTIYFGSGGTGYGTSSIANIAISGGSLSMDATNKPLNVSGNVTISSGTLTMGTASAALNILGNTTNNGSLTLSATFGGDINLGGNFTNNGTFTHNNRALTFNGTATSQSITGTLNAAGTTNNIPYLIANNTSINEVSLDVQTNITNSATVNSGILKLTNNTNTYTGTTTINTGELRINPSATTATFASQIKLNGGKLGTTNIATGTTFTNSSTLSLDANSTIELGNNNHSLVFANSSGVTWAGTILTIYGWTGTAGVSGTGGKLFFGVGGLSVAQLDKISFDGYGGKPILLPSGELVPSSVTVSSFTPTSGYSGTSVVITGTNFTGATAVSFGGTAATSFNVDSDTQITAIVGTGATGNISVTSPVGTGIRTGFTYISGHVTKQDGDYNTASTWLLNAVPPVAANAVILHAVTLSATATNAATSVTINSGASLTFNNASSTLTTTTLTNNGILNFTASGTLNIATGGTLTNNSTFTAGTGMVNFAGAGTVNGTTAITFNNFTINGTVTISIIPTINGTFTISGGNITATPIYGNASTLVYNTGGPYGVSFEWTGNATTAGSGVPQNVIINNSTSLTMPNASRGMAGNLNITSGTLALSGTVSADLYIAGNWTRASVATFTPNSRAVFFNGTTTKILTVAGGGMETFNYLVISGSSTLQLATGTNATVNTSNGLTLSSTNATSTLDLNGQTFTVSGGGNLSLSSGNRKVTSSLAGGLFRVTTSPLAITNPGTLELDTATTLVLETGCNFGAGNPTTINGTLQLNTNSYVDVNAPKYGSASSLIYNSGGTYGKRIEWTSNIGGAFGVPHHVTVTNNTTLEYDYDTIGPRGITGNLTISSGSKLQMGDCDGALTVMGSIVSAGELTLGTDPGDDLKVAGDITYTTGYTFNANNRAVFFIKNASLGTQTITAPIASPPTFHYVVFQVPSSGNATVVLNTDLLITAPNTGNIISFGSANDILDLNGKTLTLGTAGTNNVISGSGTFKGSNSSNVTLLGNGSIGTVNFTTGSQTLGNLTVNRQDNAIAMKLGTPLTITTSLTLTKGLVDLDAFNMSLNLTATATGNSTSYVIVDEAGTSGRLRKRVTLANNTFTFPIGDNATSADGSQYTPATVSFTAGTFSTAYMMVSVIDNKHPEMEATTDYLTRYWKLTSEGITGAASYTFSGKYHSTPTNYDVSGTESNCKPGRWNGIQWTEGTTAIGTTANTLEISVTDGGTTSSINELSAGFPLGAPEINVVGNAITIPGDETNTPSSNDFTDFGDSPTTRSSTFLIQNLNGSKGNLEITNVTIGGTDPSYFSITTSPASPVAVGGTAYMVIKFTPSNTDTDIRTATVSIENNDPNENPYTFNIQGQGIDYTECAFGTEETIVLQDFEDTPATPTWGYSTPLPTGASVTGGTAYGASGDGGNSNKFLGAKSLQVNNASTEIVFDPIDTSNLSDVNLSMRVAAFSATSASNGMEADDFVRISISKDGGTTWTDELSVSGYSLQSKWSFTSGTAIGVSVYDNNGTIENQYKPQAGGYSTNDGYSTLQITNLPLVNSLKMKITIENDNVGEIWAVENIELRGKRKASKTWDGSDWSGDGNPPTSAERAIIDGDYDSAIEGAGYSGCECEIISGNTLTIASNHTIDIQSDFTNNGMVIFEDSSSLLQHNNTALNTGNVTIKRNTQPMYRYDFTYWSSPLFANADPSDDITEEAFTLKELSPFTLFDKYYKWNHAAATPNWQTIPVGAEVMVPGRGYIVRAPQTYGTDPADPDSYAIYTANFDGIPNNGIVRHAVSGPDLWNLLGNPYPSAISADLFFDANVGPANGSTNTLEGSIYLWTHNSEITETGTTGIYTYSNGDYACYNGTGSTDTKEADTDPTPGDPEDNKPKGYIVAGQSFFIKGTASGEAIFNNGMRVAGENNQFFRPGATEPLNNWETSGKHRVWLNMKGQTKGFNQLLVGYIENATNEWDIRFDGESFGGNQVTFYSLLENKKLTIQGRALPFNNQDEVPLGYKSTLNGTLTISIDEYDGLFEGQDIYLEDKLLNIVHDLKASPYSFTTTTGSFNQRFVLRYLPNETLSNPELEKNASSVMIWKNQDDLNVKSTFQDISKITIYDILGRKVFEQDNINASEFNTPNVVYNHQTLIVKIELNDYTIVTKKVIF